MEQGAEESADRFLLVSFGCLLKLSYVGNPQLYWDVRDNGAGPREEREFLVAARVH